MQLVEWLPKLVGIERAVELVIGDQVVRCIPEEAHEEQLTRPDVTASVHYIRFELTPDEIDRFASSPVLLRIDHDHYQESTELSDDTKRELLEDLRGA
jgi:hypothetical protein